MLNLGQITTNADKDSIPGLFSSTNYSEVKRIAAVLADRIRRCRSLTSEVMRITPAQAEYILKYHNGRNRPVRPPRVAEYAQKVVSGRMKITSQGLSFGLDGNLNNGQHRLLGVIKAGVPCDFYVAFGEDNEVFDVLDTGSGRTGADALHTSGAHNVTRLAATVRLIIEIGREHWFSGSRLLRIDNDEITAFVDENPDVNQCVSEAEIVRRKVNCVSPPVAAAFYLIKNNSKHAHKLKEFMVLLGDGAGLAVGSPILKLRDGLQTRRLGGEYANSHFKSVATAAGVINAWNKWLAGQTGSIRWNGKTDFPNAI